MLTILSSVEFLVVFEIWKSITCAPYPGYNTQNKRKENINKSTFQLLKIKKKTGMKLPWLLEKQLSDPSSSVDRTCERRGGDFKYYLKTFKAKKFKAKAILIDFIWLPLNQPNNSIGTATIEPIWWLKPGAHLDKCCEMQAKISSLPLLC